MGLLSKFENKMEDGIEGAAGALGRSSLSPVQITKKAEKQMRREKIVGAGKQYAPTLYTVLVSPEDDSKLFKYYPTLAGETETYLMAKAREMGYVMDGQPLVRFLSDPQLKKGKFEVVAEMVASSIVEQLRDDEMRRYGLPTSAGRRRGPIDTMAQRERTMQPQMQPLQNLQQPQPEPAPGQYGSYGQQGAQPYQQPQQVQPQMQRHPMTAEEMNVPSVLGSQVNEVPRASHAHRGVSESFDVAPANAAVDLGQLQGNVSMAQQVGDNLSMDLPGGSPVVVMPAMSQDVDAGAAQAEVARGSGIDAVFGEGASTVDFQGRSRVAQQDLQVYLYDEARDRAYALTGDVQHIGRESANDIVVPDINISRVHAEIHMQPNGQWVITDLGSTNGLFVNGRQVQSAALSDADMISLGTSTLEFQLLS